MPIDINKNLSRWEPEDTRQFTMTATATRPSTVAFIVFGTDTNTIALQSVQSGATVQESGNTTGLFYMIRVLPSSAAIYEYEWRSWDASSRTYIERGEFEIIRTAAVTNYTGYGSLGDIQRSARQLIGRTYITPSEIRDYAQPADDLINAKLGLITTVPVSPTPPILRDAVKVLALAGMYSERHSQEDEDISPAIIRRREEVMQFLQDVVDGNAVLVVTSGTTLLTEQEVVVTAAHGYKPTFDLRDWVEQRVDPDAVTADEDADD